MTHALNPIPAADPPLLAAPVTAAPPPGREAVTAIVDGYKRLQILRAGFRSGLFDWLDRQGAAERPAIVEATGVRGAHAAAFLQALEDMGLIARDGPAYRLSPGLREVLCADAPWSQAETVEALLAPGGGWSDLDAFLRDGWEPPRPSPTPPARHPFQGEVRRLLDHLDDERAGTRPLDAARSILCFDGAAGLLAAALRQRFPQAAITAVAAPDALPAAQALLRDLGLEGRLRLLVGTPLDRPASGAFEAVILFHALYPVRKSIDGALAQAADSLQPGGQLWLAHWFCLEDCETAPGGLRDLDRAVLTDSHPLCGVERFVGRLEQAGLIQGRRCDLAGDYGNTKLHSARKPDEEAAR